MRIRFKSNQGHAQQGFRMGREYEMDDKSARHWIEQGIAVEVTAASARTGQAPNPAAPAHAPAPNQPKP